MQASQQNKPPTFQLRLFLIAAGLLILGWIAGEANFYFGQPDSELREQLAQQALDGAVLTFREAESALIADTRRLKSTIQPLLTTGQEADPTRIYNRLRSESGFRGISVFRDRNLFTWSGNPITYLPSVGTEEVFTNVVQSGFVIYFVSQITFFQDDGTRYDIVTTRLIRRSGASPQLLTRQYDLTREWAKEQTFPVHYRFFDLNTGPVTARVRTLGTASVDSVGFVTVSTADFPAIARDWERNMAQFRWVVITLLAFLIWWGLLIWMKTGKAGGRASAAVASAGTLTIWGIMSFLELPFIRLLRDAGGFDLTNQLQLLFDSFFISAAGLLLVVQLAKHAGRDSGKDRKWSVLTFIGIASGVVFGSAWSLSRVYEVILLTQTGVTDLRVFPALQTWIVYLASLILTGTAVYLIFQLCRFGRKTMGRFLFYTLWFAAVCAGAFLFYLIHTDAALLPVFFWAKYLGILVILVLISASDRMQHFSPLSIPRPRAIALLIFLVTLIQLPLYFDASIQKENETMLRMAVNYATTGTDEAEEISRELIRKLLEDGVITQVQTLEAAPAFPVQAVAQFRQQVSRQIQPEWGSYTIMAFLLDGRLNIIADYGSQPSFMDRFSSSFHDEVRNFIRYSLQRPFARLPIIETENRFRGFPIFIKGLQSIPSDFPTQPSWLVTFVLVEGNSFGRPVNDALAFHERDRESWNRFVVTEYVDGRRNRSTSALRTPLLSERHLLTEELTPAPGAQIIRRSATDRAAYRKLIYGFDERTAVMVTVRDVTFLNYIFSGFRFFVALLIVSLLAWQIRSIFTKTGLPWSGRIFSRRFQDRILDSYLIATLLFMIALAVVTEYIVGLQNIRIAEQELYRNLSAVETRLINQRDGSLSRSDAIQLEEVDIMLFEGGRLTQTTAPEIFRLQLISDFMPFESYTNIFSNHQTTVFQPFSIGELSVLMGYRAFFENGEVRIVIGIPAYTRSAIYEQEFLQTTTYLIAFYIIIFIFFTGIAWGVSRKLTQPLSEFESGLKRISAGDLDTTIPVSSDDEIGELARAYNEMVLDLRNVRAELAEAERDAAWSEMARQIAHEIKNPLTPMKLSIQHLQRQMAMGDRSMEELKPAIEKLSGMLVNQIESLNRIAGDFSAFAKPLTGKQEKRDLNELITETLPLFEQHQQIAFRFSASPEPSLVFGSSDEIKRVFINLIKNAIEAMPQGGLITLSVQQQHNGWMVSIADTGTGMAPEVLENIFAPNFSTKTSGTGLGLAICKKIMDAHSGHISVQSDEAAGTTFSLWFPVYREN
ncbi:HAMP domain-containing protein [Cyclonatronum proteinivorum]|uniref:histidine kinase n=1 Tax=Cyclonatronum proteinivorum TaxID=1457365 RepID=A0A345UIH3_9BACT|nr:HAMP domain-containing sensor histidine kinase [Cyclonatronum proteinivorum]AXJ00275.1 HAMP domain-containing protein [Cyclonatronum proteinivorum]